MSPEPFSTDSGSGFGFCWEFEGARRFLKRERTDCLQGVGQELGEEFCDWGEGEVREVYEAGQVCVNHCCNVCERLVAVVRGWKRSIEQGGCEEERDPTFGLYVWSAVDPLHETAVSRISFSVIFSSWSSMPRSCSCPLQWASAVCLRHLHGSPMLLVQSSP